MSDDCSDAGNSKSKSILRKIKSCCSLETTICRTREGIVLLANPATSTSFITLLSTRFDNTAGCSASAFVKTVVPDRPCPVTNNQGVFYCGCVAITFFPGLSANYLFPQNAAARFCFAAIKSLSVFKSIQRVRGSYVECSSKSYRGSHDLGVQSVFCQNHEFLLVGLNHKHFTIMVTHVNFPISQ